MTKADEYMRNDIVNIFQNGYKDVNPRPKYEDGTPAHTISVNHVMRKYDLSKGEFPILTLRPIAWKTGIKEIFTIYQKPTNVISEMEEIGVKWWSPWDIGNGTIGQRYGATVKRYDLINNLIKDIQNDPYGRRKIMSLWQETDLKETDGLAPCAFLTIWNVRHDWDGKDYLDMTMVQRSSDFATAGCINQVQYMVLLLLFARHLDLTPGKFTWKPVNVQIYDRHMDQVKEMLGRDSVECAPYIELNPDKKDFYDFTPADIQIKEYPYQKIKTINPQLPFPLGI